MAKRECGDCSECCVQLPIKDPTIPKGRHTPCVHLCNGCSIYKTRPPVCKGYQCYWLGGFLPEYLKPNETGLLFGPGSGPDGESIIQVSEKAEGIIDANWDTCCKAVQRINQRRQAKGLPSNRALVFVFKGYSSARTYSINLGISVELARERFERERAAALTLAV